ncbi:hypothetical protein [Pandoraea apista]|uniref:CopG family transcriptional regulator n=1 Tax=Pandoraea apista TaxID=93218 RepID=A0ABX9ZL49_9BURK|nr:hypothetical protein [Pandoraea apista]RRJ30808.1 hypothetical protein EIB05_13585 [Pandoraea apista]RRJ74565.1 hypothetical protein EIL82_15020 [Pandoraea apista]RSD06400.1 hypothetical protein EJB12_21955 [Pandoraea apista]RSD14552.1 hypothetical protein EIZ52_18130 [Pandoraea apista]RSK77085.1 hypothetical protein EJE83_19430 [Pandoraea apista]
MNKRNGRSRRPALVGSARYHEEIEARQALAEALEAHAPVLLAALAFYIKTDAQRRDDVEEDAARWRHMEDLYPYGGHPSKGSREHIRTAVDRERGNK